MGNEVYANGREVSCKAAAGKSICAMPDVCMTPPQTPATPPGVPIPYPNTAMASDCTEGSKNVKISGKEVMLKDKSHFKKSMGNEAGCAPMKGVVTHKNMGKVYFTAWSMDVKFEGENVVRNLDLTTHNHGSMPTNTPTWPYLDKSDVKAVEACKEDVEKVKDNCPNAETAPEKDCENPKCREARRCMLVPKDRAASRGGCCEAPKKQTGHHLIPAHCFKDVSGYKEGQAPCVCAEGFSWHREDSSPYASNEKTHPEFHEWQDVMERRVIAAFPVLKKLGKLSSLLSVVKPSKYASARNIGVATHKKVFPDSGCSAACLQAQLDAYHKQPDVGMQDDTPVLAKKYGNRDTGEKTGVSVSQWEDRLKQVTG